MVYVVRAGEESFLGDRRWTAEAFANLLKNCMEHTPEGGRITVTARETALFTEITVEDTGEGFREEELPRIFDRFYKGGNAAEGSVGIGLALARSIVTAQNGTLKAKNASEGGACPTGTGLVGHFLKFLKTYHRACPHGTPGRNKKLKKKGAVAHSLSTT